MAEAIVGPLLSKLQEVAVNEAKALAAVGGEIDKLRDKLMWLQALVHETDLRSRHDGSRLTRVLACQIREVAFEAEDAVDKFYLQAGLSRRWWRAAAEFILHLRTQMSVRFVLSREIQSMNARLEEIVQNSTRYSSTAQGSSGNDKTWRASRAIPPMREDWDNSVPFELICRSDETKKLEKKLKDEADPAVIRVVGVGGIGKRALLRDAYEKAPIKEHFDVCVSFPMGMDGSSIVQQIKEKLDRQCSLKNKTLRQARCLVVIGSPMSNTSWTKVRAELLPMAGEGSKILLSETSKHKDLNEDDIIPLKPLDKSDSEKLFNYAIGNRGRRTSKYKTEMIRSIRDHIEQITGGLPLAVVLLAKFMRTMDYSKWEDAAKYIMGNKEDNLLKTILSVCIDDLPDELKSCLLFTAGFPKNRVIDAHQLVRLWMAEGFLTQHHGVETEQLGQCYLKELIYRGLLQLVDKTTAHGGRVESVAVHDQIHPLLRSEAQRTSFMDVHYGGCIPAPGNTRRLALHNYNDKFPALSNNLDKLRTVVSYSDGNVDNSKDSELNNKSSMNEPKLGMRKFLQGSPYLRVINLEGIKVTKKEKEDVCALPKEIGDMVHLQYLGVRCQSLKNVPSSIENLGKLQTIDVRGTEVRELPKSLWKIKTLRHVLGDKLFFPRSTGDLKLMRTLETVTIHYMYSWLTAGRKRGKKFGLRFLNRLHVVGLNESQRQDLEAVLRDLSSLESLSLSGDVIPINLFAGASAGAASCLEHVVSLELDGKLLLHNDKNMNFSDLVGCLSKLTHLVLRRTKIAQDFIHMIAPLPVLAKLELHIDSYTEEKVVFCTHGFSSLKVLRISGLHTLKIIIVPDITTRGKKAIKRELIDMPDQVDVETHERCSFCSTEGGQQQPAAMDNQVNGGEDGQSPAVGSCIVPNEAMTHPGSHNDNEEATKKQLPLPTLS